MSCKNCLVKDMGYFLWKRMDGLEGEIESLKSGVMSCKRVFVGREWVLIEEVRLL